MLRRLTPALVLATLLGPAGPAGAEPDYARPGAYLGVGALLGIPTGSGANGDVGPGVAAQLGYRFLPHLAAELNASILPLHRVDQNDVGRTKVIRASFDVKAPVLTGRVQPYLRTGLGLFLHTTTEIINLDLGVPLGGGVDYYLDENWYVGFDAAYVFHTDWVSDGQSEGSFDAQDLGFFSLGLGFGYRF